MVHGDGPPLVHFQRHPEQIMQLNRHTERGDSVRLTEFKRKHRVQAYSDLLLYLWSKSVDVFISVGSTLTRPCGNLFISHEVTSESYVQLTCLVFISVHLPSRGSLRPVCKVQRYFSPRVLHVELFLTRI